ncbi:MAG: hypothetical protein IIB81_04970, partial [Nanoarchaeota archaeon]|nr:hypothetical protein [Nanoarchaeota archaeon]
KVSATVPAFMSRIHELSIGSVVSGVTVVACNAEPSVIAVLLTPAMSVIRDAVMTAKESAVDVPMFISVLFLSMFFYRKSKKKLKKSMDEAERNLLKK